MFPVVASMARTTRRALFAAMAFAWLALVGGVAQAADRTEPLPKELTGVGIEEHMGQKVPADLEFRDEEGKPFRLASLFGRDRPVIFTMNYTSCPQLCSLQLDGFVEGLLGVDWTVGREFDVVTVSIDPQDTPERMAKMKRKYLRYYGRAGAEAGWHFLSGSEANVKALAQALGFGYRYLEDKKEYSHSAAVILATPDGTVARYLYGVQYLPKTVRLAIVESAKGTVGSVMDQILMFCFKYDPESQRYTMTALTIMRAGGILIVLVIIFFLAKLWRTQPLTQGAHA